jgi:hypothetical protein
LHPAQIIADDMADRTTGNMNRLIVTWNQSRYRMTTYVELRLVSGTVVDDPKAVAELP